MKIELDDEECLLIKRDDGEVEAVVPGSLVDDLISFIKSDNVRPIKVRKCLVNEWSESHCVIDRHRRHDCYYASLYNHKESCPHWKEVSTYEIKE